MLFYPSDRLPATEITPQRTQASTSTSTKICNRWRALPLVLALALTGALAACSDKAAPAPDKAAPAKVGVITVQSESQTLTSALPGRTSAFMSAEIRPQISGIVQKRLFTEGTTVKAGQALYQIDPAPYQVAEASAKAALAKAQAQARTAQVNAQRNAELVQIDAISRQAYEESQASAQQSASDVAVAQAALQAARINLGYTRITAPIAGRTSLSTVTPGALVTANQAGVLTTIAQIDPVYVDITQSSTDLLQLKRELAQGRFERVGEGAARITLQLEDGSTYPHAGRLQFTGVNVNPSTGAVTLRAVVPNPDGVLMPGMYVQTLLPTGVSSDALLLPQQAVTRDIAGKASALLVNAEHKVERRPIEVDRAIGNRWMVSAGVAPGDTVIVDGFQRIKVGDTVNPQPVQLPGAAPTGATR
ncbi:MAG: efflux RND transporter periplasmic adaptor subunit [Giesbergeria sp.]|nr:efflux RND transporter periplasmic adaptor subunit [Giesbergeria sp.]